MTQIDDQDTTSIDELKLDCTGLTYEQVQRILAWNKAVVSDQVAKARIEWLDEQISHLLQDIYPTDLFAEPTQADFDRINKYDANLHTRLHCDGIRHGLHILRREVRGLSARDELATLNGVKK